MVVERFQKAPSSGAELVIGRAFARPVGSAFSRGWRREVSEVAALRLG
jgi:hypothetical protein